jgi:hypothetical protein
MSLEEEINFLKKQNEFLMRRLKYVKRRQIIIILLLF